MLMKLLSDEDKKHLLELAKLLAVSDKPLLWDGKTSNELTSGTNIDALSIQEGEQERELIADLEISAGVKSTGFYGSAMAPSMLSIFSRSDVCRRLIENLNLNP